MKFESVTRASLALLVWAASQAAGADDYRHNQCTITPTNNNSQTLRFVVPLGDLYVGRDAPIGTPIGQAFMGRSVVNPDGLSVVCNRHGWQDPNLVNPEFVSVVSALGRPYTGTLPTIAGRNVNGKVFHTSVDGIGVAVELGNPFFGPGVGDFTTPTRLAPFTGTNYFPNQAQAPTMAPSFSGGILLVKIGPIAPGTNQIAPDILFEGSMMPAVPKAFSVAVSGTVRAAQCDLTLPNPISANPVDLGEWRTDDFTGPGSFTDSVPLSINLQNCESNSGPPDLGGATAHVTLTGTNGSTIIDKDIGLFSLDAVATARGVGIQMLLDDGSPVKLGEAFPVIRIPASGTESMNFKARLYQLPDGTPVTGGTTSSALNFTVTYQ